MLFILNKEKRSVIGLICYTDMMLAKIIDVSVQAFNGELKLVYNTQGEFCTLITDGKQFSYQKRYGDKPQNVCFWSVIGTENEIEKFLQ
jgi:hypothetical protein